MHDMRDAVHFDFKWNRNLLFDLFRGNSRPLRNDFNLVVGDVGIGLDGEIAKRDNASGEKYQREGQHQQAVVESKVNDAANHLFAIAPIYCSRYCSKVFCNASAFETT